MKRIILLTLLIPVLAHAQRYGHTSGSTFYWNKSGEAQKQDSIRFIQDGTVTLTQSGNTLTISGAASGSATRQTWYDADGDSVVIQLSPQFLYYLQAKDGTTRMFHVDSAGNMFSNKLGIGGTTAGQQQRAFLNVIGFSDTLVTVVGSSDKGLGDSLLTVLADGSLNLYHNRDGAQVSFLSKNISTATNATNEIRIATDGSALMQIGLQSTTNTGSYSALLTGDGGFIRTSSAADFLGFLAGTDNAPIAFAAGNNARLWLTKDSTISYKPLAVRGTITRKDTKALPAGAWLATASNGAALSSSNYMVTYAFDQTTAETLTVDFSLPPTFLQVTSVELEFVSPNTDGDSVGFAVYSATCSLINVPAASARATFSAPALRVSRNGSPFTPPLSASFFI